MPEWTFLSDRTLNGKEWLRPVEAEFNTVELLPGQSHKKMLMEYMGHQRRMIHREV